MARRRLLPLIPLVVALALPGCENLWSWTADEDGFDAALEEGRSAMRVREYARAEAAFTRAVDLRPRSGEARYYLAKAAVLGSGIDVVALVRTMTDEGRAGAVAVFEYPTSHADAVYRVNAVVLEALEPIRASEAIEGSFDASDVDLDLALAYSLRGILRLRDTNNDGRIDADDVSVEDFSLVSDGDFTLSGLENIPPGDLNDMLDDLNDLLGDGGDALADALTDSGVDVEDLEEILDSLGGDISMYYVNTSLPGNPGIGDNDLDGRVDEECLNGVDDDGDGRTDEDARVLDCT